MYSFTTNIKDKENGQSLVEVIVAVVVVTMVLVGLVSAITFSLGNAQYSRNKALATKYAQEAVEWMREERDNNWFTFYGRASVGGTRYCLDTLSWGNSGVCSLTETIQGVDYPIFRREALLTTTTGITDRVNIAITVVWSQGSREPQVIVNTYLTKWR